jgi:hypothetical protein
VPDAIDDAMMKKVVNRSSNHVILRTISPEFAMTLLGVQVTYKVRRAAEARALELGSLVPSKFRTVPIFHLQFIQMSGNFNPR